MGKRPVIPPTDLHNYVTPPTRRTIRKRKVSNGNIASTATLGRPAKSIRLNSEAEDEEDSSSNDTQVLNCSSKHANNSSIFLNSTLKLEQISPATNESPRPVFTLRPSVVNGTILYDLTEKPWRLGNPIGKGNFGEIFLASDNITLPVTNENAKFVVKIEPHSNGPLFVEIHCLMNTARKVEVHDGNDTTIKIKQEHAPTEQVKSTPPSGIPDYIASGSHYFGDARYRFLVLQRFDKDLHSLIKNSCVSDKSVLTLAIQIINVLENLHDKGYCHNDVKSQNLMISKCKYYKTSTPTTTTAAATETIKKSTKYLDNYEEKQPTTDSGNSSEQEANDYDDDGDEDFVLRRKNIKVSDEETNESDNDEDFDDGTTATSNSMDAYKTPVTKNRGRFRGVNKGAAAVQYSGSNPVRSCRRQQRKNSIYDEMVNSHYLRPSNKRISYAEFFDEDGASVKGGGASHAHGNGGGGCNDGNSRDTNFISTEEDDSNTNMPHSLRRRFRTTSHTTANKRKSRNGRAVNSSGGGGGSSKVKASPAKRLTRRQEKLLNEQQQQQQRHGTVHFESKAAAAQMLPVEAEHIFLIDFGLASKYIDRGVHRPFVMDQRRAHDGTLEFTSRDAHMGAHSRRSDLECLGYNLLYWSQGFLPWKDAAAQQQQEKVHRAKEYLMTDVREMLKQIYGKDVPKFLGEFLHLVGQLAYHERPHYERYRRLFEKEYRQLGYALNTIKLDSQEIARNCIRVRKDHGAGKHDFFEQNHKMSNSHILSIMKSGGTPFQERGSIGDRVSPKNLRSKSDKKASRKKKFCWAEVLSQDPDQIARERAEKEFDREMNDEEERPVRHYEGNPTYAILDLITKNESKFMPVEDEEEQNDEEEGEQDDEIKYEIASEAEAEVSENEDEDAEEEEEEGENEEAVNSNDSDESENGTDNDDDVDMEDEGEDEEENIAADSDDDNDDVESDISEASSNSEQYGTRRGRNMQRVANRHANQTEAIKTKSSRRAVSAANSRSSKSTTASTTETTTTIKRRGRPRKIKKIDNDDDDSSNKQQITTTIKQQQQSENSKRALRPKSKRCTATTYAASAAGEIEQHNLKQFLYGGHSQNEEQHEEHEEQKLNGITSSNCRLGVGKRRRCLKKTESGTDFYNLPFGTEDDSNSNLMKLNVWNMSNENIYARNAAAVAAARTLTVGGGCMITRHYRK